MRPRAPGLTLIELLLVCALIGLVATVATLASDGLLATATLQSELERLELAIADARRQAQLTQRPLALELDLDRQRYRLLTDLDAPQPTPLGEPHRLPDGLRLATLMIDGRTLRGGIRRAPIGPGPTQQPWALVIEDPAKQPHHLRLGRLGQVEHDARPTRLPRPFSDPADAPAE